MDKTHIIKHSLQLQQKEDLLNLLNQLKFDEMNAIGIGDKYHPFILKHIDYYCNPNNTFHRYRQFKIKKKTGGFREITAPRNRSYVLLLRYVNEILKALYMPSKYAMGFTDGRSIATNAGKHINSNYIFNIDLKDFFPSINRARIIKRLQIRPFNFSPKIALLIAGLCCMRKELLSDDGKIFYSYILPQGAPTSPIITNMICDKLDHQLAGLAKRFGLTYTRYADDITFSSNHNVYHDNSIFRKELERIIKSQGFNINEKKTRLQKLGHRQEVTGIIVSDKLNVSQHYVRDIRNILYIWDRYGYNIAYARFFSKYKAEKGHIKKGNPNLINVLDGKLMYLKMIKGEKDSVYQRLYSKFKMLSNYIDNNNPISPQSVKYIETMTISDFETKNNTEIVFKIDDNNSTPKRSAYFTLNRTKISISIKKNISNSKLNKEHLAISTCIDANNRQFWLIHPINVERTPSPIDIDALNNDLESLLNLQYG
ncbi:MAG: RNA-directed DNA polymerase [Muribaculaceae bacterium]|nr:RNA-directed DNA polymerase [Muribaculaceae bacterium]